MDIDFEGNHQATTPNNGNGDDKTNSNVNTNNANQQDITDLNGNQPTDINQKNNNDQSNPAKETKHSFAEGTEVEFENAIYKIDKEGNLVNDKNEIFKKADEVGQWLKDNNFVEKSEADDDLNIDSIKNAIGVEITDETGNPVEFTNDVTGIKSYVDNVISLKSEEIGQGYINKLFSENPIIKQFVDYITLTGTHRGFGEIPDRSGIVLDKENEAQLEAVIKMAADEFGNKSINDNYIKYLKSTGVLYDEAKAQLEALINKDEQTRKDIETKAAHVRQQEEEDRKQYWSEVNKAITERRINGYLLPETIVKEVNGQKVTYNLADFNNYVSRPIETDANGNKMTGYVRDLNNLSDKEILHRDLLDAWLLWTGGSYKDLVDMAIKENDVRRLVAKAKEHSTQRYVKVNKPQQSNDQTKIIYE